MTTTTSPISARNQMYLDQSRAGFVTAEQILQIPMASTAVQAAEHINNAAELMRTAEPSLSSIAGDFRSNADYLGIAARTGSTSTLAYAAQSRVDAQQGISLIDGLKGIGG